MTKNSKILVCDDDETLCYLLKEQLLEEGFSVDTVYDGQYAIEAIKRKNYDILLLDLNMKEVSGEEVLKFVSDYNASLQVIILSAQSEIRKAIEQLDQIADSQTLERAKYYIERLEKAMTESRTNKNTEGKPTNGKI